MSYSIRVRDRIAPLDPQVVSEQQKIAAEQARMEKLRQNAARHLQEQREFLAKNQLTLGEKRIAAVKAQCTESTFRYIEGKVKMHAQADRESGLAFIRELQLWKDDLQESGQKVEGKV
jgi:hypothetical protein